MTKLKWREIADCMFRAVAFPRTETAMGTGYYLERMQQSEKWKVGYQGRELGPCDSKEEAIKAAETHWAEISMSSAARF